MRYNLLKTGLFVTSNRCLMEDHHIIIFDGICNLCNDAVNFIIRRDAKGLFKFTPMQSEFAQQLVAGNPILNKGNDTIILIKKGQFLIRSEAALEICRDLDGFWSVFRIFKVVPTSIRDLFYRLLAHHRYRLFGRRSACMTPTKALADRFL